jgi:hypothetical protein
MGTISPVTIGPVARQERVKGVLDGQCGTGKLERWEGIRKERKELTHRVIQNGDWTLQRTDNQDASARPADDKERNEELTSHSHNSSMRSQ